MENKTIHKKRVEQFKKELAELALLFSQKNADYGDAFFQGIKVSKILDKLDGFANITRKYMRMVNFYEKNNSKQKKLKVSNEKIEDTLRDCAIYCLMEIMKRKIKSSESEK